MKNRWFPPEWHDQSAVMLTWPHVHSDWAPILNEVEPVFTEISYYVSLHENVLIVASSRQHLEHIQQLLAKRGVDPSTVRLYVKMGNDTWARDHGPITVFENQKPILLDFVFNGWGNKFSAELDNEISRALLTQDAFGDLEMHSIDFVLEGGGIETDGDGTLLTTSRCLLAHSRNPALTYSQIEAVLATQLGIERFLWLDHGALAGDDTDSHIDTLARFCSADTLCYVSCDDPADEHYSALQAMAADLAQFRQANGEPYKLVALPMPNPIYNEDSVRLPGTYANFLIINAAVLVPTYEDENDDLALMRLAECFPEREIIAVNCKPLIEQYGSLHCVTMQIPANVLT